MKKKKLALFGGQGDSRYEPKFGSADGTEMQVILNFVNSQKVCETELMSADPAEAVEKAMLPEDIKKILAEIGEREAEIICMRYGLGGGSPMTLKEIGKK